MVEQHVIEEHFCASASISISEKKFFIPLFLLSMNIFIRFVLLFGIYVPRKYVHERYNAASL